ncbi:MAG: glutamate--tRNA ligase [bacterium]
MSKQVRVRFAPSPTGFMHLGNIRAALMNYLFAKQNSGVFVLRIEDTDVARNMDEAGYEIVEDLKHLGLAYDEGPVIGGKYGPYLQSKRKDLYQKNLDDLIENQKVYRCFCTEEELMNMRKQQIAQGNPPRYDRRCRTLSDDQIKEKLVKNIPFIWRFKINEDEEQEIYDMARGTVKFDMKNFSDFALTRSDGSFTFLFANFIDDWLMKITHVIRGEDHLTNSAMQAALFESFAIPLPRFWHLPMICNVDGKKLSKRDFGFKLEDLKKEGVLKEAILNYLAIIGTSFLEELQGLDELVKKYDFSNLNSTGSIKFDVDKLLWFNHKWISKLDLKELVERIKPFLHEAYPMSKDFSDEKIEFLIEKVRGDIKTLHGMTKELAFCFQEPEVDEIKIEEEFSTDLSKLILDLINKNLELIREPDKFLNKLKQNGKENKIKTGDIFKLIRYLLTGKFSGIGIHDLFEMLDTDLIKKRLTK